MADLLPNLGDREYAVVPVRVLHDPRLRPADKVVLLVLGAHTNKNGVCWPGIKTIQLLSGLTERTVYRALKRLQEYGWISIQARTPDAHGARSNLYHVFPRSRRPVPDNLSVTDPTAEGTVYKTVNNEDRQSGEPNIGILPPAAPTGAGGKAWKVTEVAQSLVSPVSPTQAAKGMPELVGVVMGKMGRPGAS